MSYEIRLRRAVGGRGIVAIVLDGKVVAETELNGRNGGRYPFDYGELPLDITLEPKGETAPHYRVLKDKIIVLVGTDWPECSLDLGRGRCRARATHGTLLKDGAYYWRCAGDSSPLDLPLVQEVR